MTEKNFGPGMDHPFVRESEEVFYAEPGLTLVDRTTIDFLKRAAAANRRRRSRLCVHRDIEDVVHEMLIVHVRDAYVRPHKHVGKSESLHVIEGSATMVTFTEQGDPSGYEPLGEAASGRRFFYRMPEGVYHTLLIESDWFVFHEATRGPFDKAQTLFAPWSPEESDAAAVRRFTRALCEESGAGLAAAPPRPKRSA